MGNAGTIELFKPSPVSKNDFYFNFVVGRGGYSKVWLVSFIHNKQEYAMKEISKQRVIAKNSVETILNEQKLLKILRHPFIVNMKFAFQDRINLYLVMDLLKGGDLRFHLATIQEFPEETVKFFAACIVTGLEYLHINSIVHRDIKPENLILDENGYIRITDFGIASFSNKNNSRIFSGTPVYMSPEVLSRKQHGIAVDYYALGVILYEFIIGRRPHFGKNRRDIKNQVFSMQAKLTKSDTPKGWSIEAIDFVNKLLIRDPSQRLGFGGPTEVKNHMWLKDYPWKSLLEKKIESPFKPNENYDIERGIGHKWKDDFDYVADHPIHQCVFNDYYYDWREKLNKPNETTLNINADGLLNK